MTKADRAASQPRTDEGTGVAVHTLTAGPMRALLSPAHGGRLTAMWRDDPKGRRVEVLYPISESAFDGANWPKGGIYPLAPFSNRVRNGRFSFAGREVKLPPHPASAPHAVHGFSHQLPWVVTEQTAATAALHFRHDAPANAEGWPWAFESWQRFALDGAGLTHEIGIVNRSSEPMPAGLGTHPFFAIAPGDRIQFTMDGLWRQDETGCAVALDPLAGRDRIFDRQHALEANTFYAAGFGGVASIHRRDGARILIETSAPFDHLVFHVPPGGAYCCLEPVSHVADAFNLASAGVEGTGLRILQPGETLSATVRIGLA